MTIHSTIFSYSIAVIVAMLLNCVAIAQQDAASDRAALRWVPEDAQLVVWTHDILQLENKLQAKELHPFAVAVEESAEGKKKGRNRHLMQYDQATEVLREAIADGILRDSAAIFLTEPSPGSYVVSGLVETSATEEELRPFADAFGRWLNGINRIQSFSQPRQPRPKKADETKADASVQDKPAPQHWKLTNGWLVFSSQPSDLESLIENIEAGNQSEGLSEDRLFKTSLIRLNQSEGSDKDTIAKVVEGDVRVFARSRVLELLFDKHIKLSNTVYGSWLSQIPNTWSSLQLDRCEAFMLSIDLNEQTTLGAPNASIEFDAYLHEAAPRKGLLATFRAKEKFDLGPLHNLPHWQSFLQCHIDGKAVIAESREVASRAYLAASSENASSVTSKSDFATFKENLRRYFRISWPTHPSYSFESNIDSVMNVFQYSTLDKFGRREYRQEGFWFGVHLHNISLDENSEFGVALRELVTSHFTGYGYRNDELKLASDFGGDQLAWLPSEESKRLYYKRVYERVEHEVESDFERQLARAKSEEREATRASIEPTTEELLARKQELIAEMLNHQIAPLDRIMSRRLGIQNGWLANIGVRNAEDHASQDEIEASDLAIKRVETSLKQQQEHLESHGNPCLAFAVRFHPSMFAESYQQRSNRHYFQTYDEEENLISEEERKKKGVEVIRQTWVNRLLKLEHLAIVGTQETSGTYFKGVLVEKEELGGDEEE